MSTTSELWQDILWSPDRMGEAVRVVGGDRAGARHGQAESSATPVPPAFGQADRAAGFVTDSGDSGATAGWEDWFDRASVQIGIRFRSVSVRLGDLHKVLETSPSVIRIGDEFLVVAESDHGKARLHLPAGGTRIVSQLELVNRLERALAPKSVLGEIESWLDLAEVATNRRPKARSRLLRDWDGGVRIQGVWLLESATVAGLWERLREAGAVSDLARFLVAHAFAYLLFVLAWKWLGGAALDGTLSASWIPGWTWLLVAMVIVQALRNGFQGRASIRGGVVLKRYLLERALDADLERTRASGVGGSLARVLESEMIEQISLGGGLLAVTGVLELIVTTWVFTQVAALGPATAVVLWSTLAIVSGCVYFLRARRWTTLRLQVTNQLVDSLRGHRTLLVQDPNRLRTQEEDAGLASLLHAQIRLDQARLWLRTFIPYGWVCVALGLIGWAMVEGGLSSAVVAVGVGATLLGRNSLVAFTQGLLELSLLVVSVLQVRAAFESGPEGASTAPRHRVIGVRPGAGTGTPDHGHSEIGTPDFGITGAGTSGVGTSDVGASGIGTSGVGTSGVGTSRSAVPAVRTRGLGFRYANRSKPVLEEIDLVVETGEKVLLEGPSGSGKSTLLSLLSGVRRPTVGTLRVDGLDISRMSSQQRRQFVGFIPQFHENHIFAERLAFNLLMGRRWPPTPRDLADAEGLCHALGLGPLLERMPSGLDQPVGDGGWALSHGEQSRIHLARALLSSARLLLADESFGALDPATQSQCLATCLAAKESLIVVSHQNNRSATGSSAGVSS